MSQPKRSRSRDFAWCATALVVAGVAIFASFGWSRGARGASGDRRPDVVLISIDTTRADFLTFLDPQTAPNLTRLARDGTIFTQAISGASWTLPAHVEMFTGMSPPYHGSEIDLLSIDPKLPVLAELLDAAGYATFGVYSNSYLWGNYGFDRGFDFYHSAMLSENVRAHEMRSAPRGEAALDRLRILSTRGVISAPNVVPIAQRALERAKPGESVFLFAHFMDPHSDFIPPAPFDTRFDPGYRGPIDGRGYATNKAIVDYSKRPVRQIDDRGLAHIEALYRGEIASVDQAIGRLVEVLSEHRRLDHSLVIVTSDHGEAFFEHGYPGHRNLLQDEVLHVPLLIVPPRDQRAGVRSTSKVGAALSDLLPTILDFVGLDVPAGVTGTSLRPALYGAMQPTRPRLFSNYETVVEPDGSRTHRQVYGLRTPAYKFIRRIVYANGAPVRLVEKYFDLAADPHEHLAIRDPEHPGLKRARQALDARLDDVARHWKVHPRTPRAERSMDLDGWVDELKLLGYVLDQAEQPGRAFQIKPWGLAPLRAPGLTPALSPARSEVAP